MKQPIRYSNFTQINLERILFLDIETVALAESMEGLDDTLKHLWEKKARSIALYSSKTKDYPELMTPEQLFLSEAGIHSEFSKIICISVGYLACESASDSTPTHNTPATTPGGYRFFVTSFYGDDEKDNLERFHEILRRNSDYYLCAHNGIDFDIPFICRRSLIQNIHLPQSLQILGKKPWETYWILDTMELWKFMGRRNFVSLEALTHVLKLPSPKNLPEGDAIDGSQIHSLYYKARDFDRIYQYCEQDCLAIAQVMLRIRGQAMISPDAVISKMTTSTPTSPPTSIDDANIPPANIDLTDN